MAEDEHVEDDQIEADDSDALSDETELEEFSLDDLGRAYAQAVGLPAAADPAAPEVAESRRDQVDHPQQWVDADNAGCEISPKSILEAVLFIGSPRDQKLTSKKIAALMRDVSPKEIGELVEQLNQEYEKQGTAYRVCRENGDIQLALVDELEPIRQKFYGEVREAKLSQSAIDVLSIVAYNQPLTRQEIEQLRARPCGNVLTQLTKRQLLETVSDPDNRRKKLYRTTERFLELFGLDSLDDLPRAEPEDD